MLNASPKIVYKPWGKEVWLELNNKYCYKRLYLKQGEKTSYQYHEQKIETNYLIQGKAEVLLENDKGIIEQFQIKENDFFTVLPNRKHRITALTDIILQEVSSPEVDDVIRIEDDTNRKSGLIEHEHKPPALCIVAAGYGKRLEKFTEKINKGLLPIDNKAIISHIIDKVPPDYDVVIAVNYDKDKLISYCKLTHPNRNFIFVEVDKIEGKGTGPGYSLRQCKKYLQRPFYLFTVDTIIADKLPPLNTNWLGLYPTSSPESYSTAKTNETHDILQFKNKSTEGYDNAFIGVCGIVDYQTFWQELETHIEEGELVAAFYQPSSYKQLVGKNLNWYDVGTVDNYLKLRNNNNLPKFSDDFIYFYNDRVIKLFNNTSVVQNKLIRQQKLKQFTPTITNNALHGFSYNLIQGKTLYEDDNIENMKLFLNWCQTNLWYSSEFHIKSIFLDKFYKQKTKDRIIQFLSKKQNTQYTETHIINDVWTHTISYYLDKIEKTNFDQYCRAIDLWHGDLQFDNVIIDKDKRFWLIDWRDSFGELTERGDLCYDLAKLYGGLLLSYNKAKNLQTLHIKRKNNITIEIENETTESLQNFIPIFEKFIESNPLLFPPLQWLKFLTGIIYLNMSPLHEYPMNDFLFYKGKYLLEQYYK
jgi:mannose-6-phosphate isomerase-like protein (cupin superfamily)/thiamine kinase-like enzyme